MAHTVSLLAGADAATKEVDARRAFTGVNAGVTNRKQGGVRTILADSVLPAPDSPEMRIACRCSSIIMLENACGRQMTRDVAPDHSLRPPPQAAGTRNVTATGWMTCKCMALQIVVPLMKLMQTCSAMA